MLTILIRSLIMYLSLMVTMRFMGKRQLGELEISDLVTTLLLSEIASLPIANIDIPLSHALLPILTLTALEVVLSGALLKFPALKRVFSPRPAILVHNGKPDRATMRAMRISAEELFSQLRQKDVTDPREVAYAILEPNGQISVIKRATARPATTREVGVTPAEGGMMHLVIADGAINRRNLALADKDERWLTSILDAHGLAVSDVFLLMVDDGGTVRLYPREERAS